MAARTAQAWHQTAFNAGQATRKAEAERRMAKCESNSKVGSAYSGTYLRKNDDMHFPSTDTMIQDAVVSEPEVNAFAGGRIAIGAQHVQTQMADSRRHYTHQSESKSNQAVAVCDESGTFGGRRSVTGGWSARIQRRFFLTVRQYDLTPIEQNLDPLAFIVLKFPKGLKTNKALVDKALSSLFDAIRYKLGGKRKYPLVWNIEFTRKRVAHINLLLAFPQTSYGWLLKAWSKRAGHAAGAPEIEVLHITRPSAVDEDGCIRDFENQFYSVAAYMAGLGDVLGFIKGHQYNVPHDWAPVGEGAGRMWGVQGMGRSKVSTYPIQNVEQKEAIEAYLRQFCEEKLVEYTDPKTGEVTVFNDGSFSETRRAGSLQCLMVTVEMHEHILHLLEHHASKPPAELPVKSLAELSVVLRMAEEELMTPASEPIYLFARTEVE